MAGRAAARVGAGLRSIAVSEIALPVYASALTSNVVKPLATSRDLDAPLSDWRLTAFLIGPGAGVGATRIRTLAMLATHRATLIDADAITSFEVDSAALMRAVVGPY
jgi:NAD(P)H-hydrate epimerase